MLTENDTGEIEAVATDGYDTLQLALANFRRTLLRGGLAVPSKIAFDDQDTFSKVRAKLPASQQFEFDPASGIATINICGIDCIFTPRVRAYPGGRIAPE